MEPFNGCIYEQGRCVLRQGCQPSIQAALPTIMATYGQSSVDMANRVINHLQEKIKSIETEQNNLTKELNDNGY